MLLTPLRIKVRVEQNDMLRGVVTESYFASGRGLIEYEGKAIAFSWKDVANHSMKGLDAGVEVVFELSAGGSAARARAVRRYIPADDPTSP